MTPAPKVAYVPIMRIAFALVLVSACSRHREVPTMTPQPATPPGAGIAAPLPSPPRADSIERPPTFQPFEVYVNPSGAAIVDGRVVTDAQLRLAAARGSTVDPEREVRIVADSNAPYASVIHVMDVVRDAGLTNVGLGSETPQRR